MHKREKERKNKNKKEEEENKMKYKTLIEKNSELVLTEGRLTPPLPHTHPRFASTTLLPPFPATAYPPDKGAFTLAKKIAGSLKKTHAQRIQLKHVVPSTKTCE